jgi:hypothetical protein
MRPNELEPFLAKKLKALSKASLRQFLSLHNFPGKHPFGGIFKTNALPCGCSLDYLSAVLYPSHDQRQNREICYDRMNAFGAGNWKIALLLDL